MKDGSVKMNLLLFNLRTDADDDVLGFTTDWINALAKHFERINVITMYAGRIAVSDNVQVFSIGKERGYSEPRRALIFYRTLWQILRTQRIDACFAHMIPLFAVMAWPLLRLKKIPTVLWYAHKSVNFVLRAATKLANRIVTSSKSGFQIRTSKLRIIGQGIDTSRFRPRRASNKVGKPFTIIFVGRISPIKRIEDLIESMALMKSKSQVLSVLLKIVGGPLLPSDTVYAEELKKLSKKLSVSNSIKFVGSKPFHEIHQLYADADCFVNLSETDSVDKTVLEAMACSIPVITSNIAFCDILGKELSALWVIPKRDIAILIDRILVLMHMSYSERILLGEQLRQIVVESHSLDALGKKIYDQVVLLV